ncbi:hypothetical protein EGN72_08950 [Pseudorhodobacter sp. E13]|uniref:hypothetical protein n=1 Tax=Pseudorhodobacter sp. E13 TaxID=2487931 RepID=UPI000F8DB42F|nr:hypothetical protein [Pseudorhodobacter sp. E13]RUS60342.1 hypothetical protein EGN72_08950 [Pseudorhodobacter sp. E13]
MAYMTAVKSDAKPAGSLFHSIAAPFTSFWNLLVAIGENHPINATIQKLNDTPDAELAARGTSREQEIRRIFAGRMVL